MTYCCQIIKGLLAHVIASEAWQSRMYQAKIATSEIPPRNDVGWAFDILLIHCADADL